MTPILLFVLIFCALVTALMFAEYYRLRRATPLILKLLQGMEASGHEIRNMLKRQNCCVSGPAFYLHMARLEEQRLVESWRVTEGGIRSTWFRISHSAQTS